MEIEVENTGSPTRDGSLEPGLPCLPFSGQICCFLNYKSKINKQFSRFFHVWQHRLDYTIGKYYQNWFTSLNMTNNPWLNGIAIPNQSLIFLLKIFYVLFFELIM